MLPNRLSHRYTRIRGYRARGCEYTTVFRSQGFDRPYSRPAYYISRKREMTSLSFSCMRGAGNSRALLVYMAVRLLFDGSRERELNPRLVAVGMVLLKVYDYIEVSGTVKFRRYMKFYIS